MEKSRDTFSFLDIEPKLKKITLIHGFRESQQTLLFFSTSRQFVIQNGKPDWFSVYQIEQKLFVPTKSSFTLK